MPRTFRWSAPRLLVLATVAVSLGCGEPPAEEAPVATGHMFSDQQSGVALDLPSVWAGRYRTTDSVMVPAPGLQRELTLRFVRADSSVVAAPLAVLRVFESAEWNALTVPRAGSFGQRIASDASHTLVIAMASENPLPVNTADAFGFDTLMIALNQRPLRAWLRAAEK